MTMTKTTNPTTVRRGFDTLSASRPARTRRRFLVGHQEQRAALAALVDGARAGQGGSIGVRGARGSGKTHLLDDAVADASDCFVLRSSGLEVESGLSFGTVQQLCGPLVDRVAVLRPPQTAALAAALGLARQRPIRHLSVSVWSGGIPGAVTRRVMHPFEHGRSQGRALLVDDRWTRAVRPKPRGPRVNVRRVVLR